MKIMEYENLDSNIEEISNKLNIDKDIIEFLINQGYNENEINLLTNKNYETLLPNDNITNVKEAAYLISNYIEDNEASIYIFSDYDSDGINAGYIIYDTLVKTKKALESKCFIDLYIPQRAEGYGLNMTWCEEVIKDKSNKILVITADNGITKKDEVAFLKAHNIEVLITDHHEPQEKYLPDTLIVDPHLHDLNNNNALGLCGAAVIYKICSYLLNNIYEDTSNYSNIFLPNVAIATITDMMPVTEENIIFVKDGLILINKKHCNNAIKYYTEYLGEEIKAKNIAFEFGPQLNACGRMGEVDKAISLLLTTDKEDIINLYNQIVLINDKRKEKTKKIIELCKDKIKEEDYIIVLRIVNLGGVGGNVANQLMDIYNKPVILLTENKEEILSGSARSNSIDLQVLFSLAKDKGLIESFGGHKEAAGVAINRKKIKDFVSFANTVIEQFLLEAMENASIEEPKLYVDKIISVNDLSANTVDKYKDILYFNNLEEPLFALKNVNIDKINQSKNNPNNLCFYFSDDNGNKSNPAWCWKFGETYNNLGKPEKVNLVFTLSKFKSMLVMDIKYMEAI